MIQAHRPNRADAAFAAAYAALFIGFTWLELRSKVPFLPITSGFGPGTVTIDIRIELVSLASFAFVIACAVALAWRRARPIASFLAIGAVGVAQVATGEPFSAWNVAMPLALFSVAAYADRRSAMLALGVAVLALLGLWALESNLLGRLGSLPSPGAILSSARTAVAMISFALLVLVWVAGDQVRASRERTEARFERVAQAEREQLAEARIGALAERHRIARELHDVVAHGLSVMIVQADGALYAEAEHPEAPRQALATIASTGRESLAEMRRLLGVLRDDPEASQLAPQPDLAAVPGLVERFRGAGLTVDHRVDGIARAVPPAVGLTAFRVVQESLTNVLHHVGPTRVTVTTTYATGLVGIVVVNEPGEHRPPPAPRATHGLGLLGMRERVALLGGRMAAGPTPGGGFEVRVELPDSAAASQAVPAPWGVPDAGPEAGMAGWRP